MCSKLLLVLGCYLFDLWLYCLVVGIVFVGLLFVLCLFVFNGYDLVGLLDLRLIVDFGWLALRLQLFFGSFGFLYLLGGLIIVCLPVCRLRGFTVCCLLIVCCGLTFGCAGWMFCLRWVFLLIVVLVAVLFIAATGLVFVGSWACLFGCLRSIWCWWWFVCLYLCCLVCCGLWACFWQYSLC